MGKLIFQASRLMTEELFQHGGQPPPPPPYSLLSRNLSLSQYIFCINTERDMFQYNIGQTIKLDEICVENTFK